MYDIIFLGDKTVHNQSWKELKEKFPVIKSASNLEEAKRISITKMFWVVWPDVIIKDDFNFDYEPDQWSLDYIHVFKNAETYDGICLVPKATTATEREFKYRFFTDKKEVDIVASNPKPFDFFYIDSYKDYVAALENASTELFWMGSYNITHNNDLINSFYISHHDQIDRKQNHAFVHRVNDEDMYNGLFLLSKHVELTEREIEYRFPAQRKEWDLIGSGPGMYEKFEANTYEEYEHALKTSKTELFYIIPSTVTVDDNFKFDVYFDHANQYDRKINHVYLNGKHHDGIILCSKYLKISKREWYFRFIANKKEHDIVASHPKPYDVVFISYEEPNADENYAKLLEKVPTAKRVHGVKGIHQAHIEAAKLCTTPMFWIVDGDAKIVDSFDFSYQVPAWQYNHVHVWRSKNPINGLVYGYGGIKLFPTQECLNMDVSKPDMTTSISDKFVAMPEISNVTGFNTDPFNTWKSAFRECCKLSSKIIDRQKDDETSKRLRVWCTYYEPDAEFADYALKGAKEGAAYGTRNQGNIEALKMINDFEWLKEKFNGNI